MRVETSFTAHWMDESEVGEITVNHHSSECYEILQNNDIIIIPKAEAAAFADALKAWIEQQEEAA